MLLLMRLLIKFAASLLVLRLVSPLSTAEASTDNARMNSSYLYFGNPSSYITAVNNAVNSLDVVYPSYFDLNTDGSLKLTTAVSQGFVDEMHRRGIKVVPFLSNHWNRSVGRAALTNRITLAKQIAAAVQTYQLDGVNVDIENLTQEDRAHYVDFVRLLRAALPDKEISIAVAANPYGSSSGWQGSYDYAGLAQHSDYLVIMAYDEHYETGPAGPVASIPFIEKSLQYAVKTVPSDQIVLALPFYGRIWRDGGGHPNGYGISNKTIDNLITEFHGTRYFDSKSQTSYAKITIKASDRKPVIGGKALSTGTYTIWYANETTTKKTLTLAEKYNLLGASSWSLGQESENTWSYFNLWLNGVYFNDIQYHWAKDPIYQAYKNGWVNGVSSVSFAPNGALTRAQAAAMLVRSLNLPIIDVSEAGTSFSDTAGHWAKAEIETAKQYGIIQGVGDNRFAPDKPVTREQMAVMLYNLMESTTLEGAAPDFYDVTADGNPWSYEAIEAVSVKGIYAGFDDGSFRPGDRLTRAQMTVILERLFLSGWDGIRLV